MHGNFVTMSVYNLSHVTLYTFISPKCFKPGIFFNSKISGRREKNKKPKKNMWFVNLYYDIIPAKSRFRKEEI